VFELFNEKVRCRRLLLMAHFDIEHTFRRRPCMNCDICLVATRFSIGLRSVVKDKLNYPRLVKSRLNDLLFEQLMTVLTSLRAFLMERIHSNKYPMSFIVSNHGINLLCARLPATLQSVRDVGFVGQGYELYFLTALTDFLSHHGFL